MSATNHFLSCDWGTTNFRLRLVQRDGLRVLYEVETGEGVSGLAKAWKENGTESEEARTAFYIEVLRRAADILKSRAGVPLDELPVVISGMASSTLGLKELPYRSLPVSTDGTDFRMEIYPPSQNFPHVILLISGLRAGEEDVMRGEETQLIGCLTEEMKAESGRQLIIHPGTHAKHITIESGRIIGFQTFMTGEAFKLFSTGGVLSGSVEASELDEATLRHFEAGVRAAQEFPLLHALFTVRTGDLFGKRRKGEAFQYLSGLLIGTELHTLRNNDRFTKYLCAGPTLHAPYTAALRTLRLDGEVKSLPPEWEEGSVIRGQAMVLAQHEASLNAAL